MAVAHARGAAVPGGPEMPRAGDLPIAQVRPAT
jgi:hypothetical protein